MPGALLPILHALQEEFGYVHREAVPLVAESSTCRAPRCMASSPSTTTSAARRPAGTSSSSAGPRPARRSAATRSPHARRRSSASRSARPRPTAASPRAGLLPRPLRHGPSAMIDGRVVGRLDDANARRAPRGVRRDDASPSSSRAMPARVAVGADEVAAAIAGRRRPARRSTSRSCATARAACLAGAAGRGRDADGPHRLRPGDRRRDVDSAARRRLCSGRRAIRCVSAPPRRSRSSSARRG